MERFYFLKRNGHLIFSLCVGILQYLSLSRQTIEKFLKSPFIEHIVLTFSSWFDVLFELFQLV